MDEDAALEERLLAHGRAFEGLMSLTSAKYYYEQDNSTQWQKKKQTKEEKRAARKAKLDPKNIRSAKDVMDENERKRKRELGEEDDTSALADQAIPTQSLNVSKNQNKKQKLSSKSEQATTDKHTKNDADKRREKRSRQKEKARSIREKEKTKQKERKQKVKVLKREAKEARSTAVVDGEQGEAEEEDDADDDDEDMVHGTLEPNLTSSTEVVNTIMLAKPGSEEATVDEEVVTQNDMEKMDVSDLQESNEPLNLSREASPDQDSTFSQRSANASSNSSLDIPKKDEPSGSLWTQSPSQTKESHEAIKARLQAKIEAMRIARKAVTEEGQPVRTRAELIESRRRKEESRKKHKKELRQQAREVEQQAKAEVELARLRGSGSPTMSSGMFTPPISTDSMPNFSFGRVAFEDGELLDASGKLQIIKKKGAVDPKSALTTAERKAERLKNMNEAQRADLESKELWLNAKKRAHGERVRDDVSLLKKTLKRKEKQKFKSGKEWKAREEGVKKSQEIKQRKREGNLAKRRDDKGKKGGKKNVLSEKQKQKRAKKKAFG